MQRRSQELAAGGKPQNISAQKLGELLVAAPDELLLRLDLPENLWARMKAWFRDGF